MKLYILPLIGLFFCFTAKAQHIIDEDDERSHWAEDGDSIETTDVPRGLTVWRIQPRFADVQAAIPDTMPHGFQNDAFTEGRQGTYNTTGNLGSPRISRLFFEQQRAYRSQFIFAGPYDFFLKDVDQLLFTNTLSPITNLTYHECGNKQNGEDRITALFGTNVNKRLGLGFRLDYLYGRGYYEDQHTAHFNGTLYGSYRGERYSLHAMYYANHLKNTENGGIEDDSYITVPEAYPTKYGTADMPMLLTKTWNKLNVNTFYFSHHYNMGFHRYLDEEGNVVKRSQMTGMLTGHRSMVSDSTKANTADSTLLTAAVTDSLLATLNREFVPVSRIIHTFRLDHNNRRFLCNDRQNATTSDYFRDFYLPGDSANDYTQHLRVSNTVAFELCEGFNPWMKTGLRLYATHDLDRFTQQRLDLTEEKATENHITLGGQFIKQQGRLFHFNVLGEITTTGSDWGEFNVEGHGDLSIPLRRDSLHFDVDGYVRGEQPSYYMRHYHGRNAWWDRNDLDQEFHARIGATLRYRSTKLSFHFQTIQNYTYLQEQTAPLSTPDASAANAMLHGVAVAQAGSNLSLMGVTLQQNFHWGIFHWDNALTYQVSSDKDIMPVPTFNGYTNLYLSFRIARVLHTEFGTDLRYFTSYYAPTYSPIVGQYCLQDAETRVKVGNYPIVNVYLNFHLKNTRFYVMGSHVNYKSGAGRPFLVPHYPINRLVLRLGISWNFFN